MAQASIPGVQHAFAEVNGTRLHYVVAGKRGDPVLLVHGFPETWWAFRELIPLLADRHRVYAVDLRGFGDSAVADEGSSAAIAAEDLHALVSHLSVGPMHVLGQDVSGGVVFRLAAMHPEDLLSLTAVEAGLAGFGAEHLADVAHGGAWYVGALAAPGVARLLFENAAAAFIGDYLYPFFDVAASAVGAADIEEYARTYGRPGGFGGAAALYRGMIADGEEQRALAQSRPLRMPVTAVGSRGGDFTNRTFSSVSASNVTAIDLPAVGHYVAQEAPQRLAELLLDAFGQAARRE